MLGDPDRIIRSDSPEGSTLIELLIQEWRSDGTSNTFLLGDPDRIICSGSPEGSTLIELLAVIAIIAILIALFVPAVQKVHPDRAAGSRVRSDVTSNTVLLCNSDRSGHAGRPKGVTLIEPLVVIAIIAFLIALVMPAVQRVSPSLSYWW